MVQVKYKARHFYPVKNTREHKNDSPFVSDSYDSRNGIDGTWQRED
jgi:hypothetical protein